jgi:hypothetical protein
MRWARRDRHGDCQSRVRFLNWTDGGTIVSDLPQFDFVADVNRELVANFAAVITITATASPAEGGIVTGTGNYNAGETAKLWAITAPGYNFLNWTEGGVVVSTSDVYTFVTEGSRTLVANFVKAIPTYITMGNFSGQPGRALTLAATLYDKSSNVVLAGKNLMFAIDGVTLSASVVTDATGKRNSRWSCRTITRWGPIQCPSCLPASPPMAGPRRSRR